MDANNDILEILDVYSTKKFYMEYEGYLVNHIAHGLIALHRLGANKRRLQEFVTWYIDKHELEPSMSRGYVSRLPTEENVLSAEKFHSILGKHTDYYVLVDHYNALLNTKYGGSLRDLVRNEYTLILDSLHVGLLHGLIQIGYGLAAGSPRAVVDGLAYQSLHHVAPSLETEDNTVNLQKHSLDVLDILERLKNDKTLGDMLKAACQEVETSGKLNRTYLEVSVENKPIRSMILQYVEAIKLPDGFEDSNATMVDIMKLTDWLIDVGITLYVCAEYQNDFFLLHGVTSAWALQQVLAVMDNTDVALKCIKHLLAFLLSLYVSMGSPSINTSYLENELIATQNLADYPEEVMRIAADEHLYKLVQVCCEMGEKYKDTKRQMLYKVACRTVMDVKSEFFIY